MEVCALGRAVGLWWFSMKTNLPLNECVWGGALGTGRTVTVVVFNFSESSP